MIKSLLDGGDAPRVLAADDIFDLFRKLELLLVNDLLILDDVYRDIVVDESENIQIHEVDRAFDLDDIFLSHLVAFCVFDDCDAAVQFIEVKVFVDIHASASFDVVENKAFRDTSYIQCIFYHVCFLSVILEFLPYIQCYMFQFTVLCLP